MRKTIRILGIPFTLHFGREGCPDAAHMGEFACKDRSQCWEPCGELGNDDAHVRVASPEAHEAVERALKTQADRGGGE